MNDGKREMQLHGLEVLDTGLNLAELDLHGGEGFWEEVRRFCRESRLEAAIDGAMGGRAAPRVWAVMESPGAGPAAAAAALGIAVVLADRGQAVVLVDADEQEPRISRWLGRSEQEGWIDMVRFGASLHGASVPLPSDGRRGAVLGVGSFAPTGVTPDEVADLLGRLRRQADDLVLVLPAKLRSLPWLEAAQIRLLGWDLLARSGDDTGRILTELDRMGAMPEALLGFGMEEYHAIQERLSEREPEAVPPAPDLADADAGIRAEQPVAAAAAGPRLGSEGAVSEAQTGRREDPGAPQTPSGQDLVAGETPAARPRGRRTSGVFVALAVVAVVCLGGLALFLAGQFDRPTAPAGVSVAEMDSRRAEPAERAAAGDGSPAAVPSSPAATDQTDAAPPGDDAPVAVPSSPAATPADRPVEDDVATEPSGDEPAAGEVVPETATAPGTAEAAEPEEGTEAAGAGTAPLDRAAFREPVGQDGWSLWLYSFPDAESADVEVRRLERRGLRAVARAVEIEDRGRWFRVYTGSFASRDQARAAVEPLMAELKHDWVIPARF